MFTPQTQQALVANLPFEAGQYGLVSMPAEVYRELVQAARAWDAHCARPTHAGVGFVEQPDGSYRIAPI